MKGKGRLAVILFLGLGFLLKIQAQKIEIPLEQATTVAQEVNLINDLTPLNRTQTLLLTDILSKRDQMLSDGVRTQWKKELILTQIESVLRYGEKEQYRRDMNQNAKTEILSEKEFNKLIRTNKTLLTKLKLN